MTYIRKSATSPDVPQRKRWDARILLSLPKGMLERIATVLDKGAGEVRLDFIRSAIEREIDRRERKLKAEKKGEMEGP